MEAFTDYFSFIYILFAIILFFLIVEYSVKKKDYLRFNQILIIIFTILFIILFSLRDIDVGVDTQRYLNSYYSFTSLSNLNFGEIKDIGLYFIFAFGKVLHLSESQILWIFAMLYLVPLCFAFIKMETQTIALLFFSFISFFFFRSMGINIMRQGIASSFFLLALVLSQRENNLVVKVLCLIAFAFHSSIILSIIVYFFSNKIKTLKFPLIILVVSIVLSAIKFNLISVINFIPGFDFSIQNRLESYLTSDNLKSYKTGFRYDFLLFNLFFGILSYYFYQNLEKGHYKNKYLRLLSSYVLLTSYFVLMFNVPFSDRFGLLSWILIPLLLSPMLQPALSGIKYKGQYLYILSVLLMLIFSNIGGV